MGAEHGSDNRWQGYSHQELYDRLHSGPGGSAAGAVADNWSGLSEALASIQQDIDDGVRATGATWAGAAADHARAAVGPLADWAAQAAIAADTMRQRTESQGNLLGNARARMPPPIPVQAEVPEDMTLSISQIVRAQADYEISEAISNAAEQQAFRVMASYESGTVDNVGALAEFGQPPVVVVDTVPIVSSVTAAVPSAGATSGAPRVAGPIDARPSNPDPVDSTAPVGTNDEAVASRTSSTHPAPALDIVVEANFPVEVHVTSDGSSALPVVVENHSPG